MWKQTVLAKFGLQWMVLFWVAIDFYWDDGRMARTIYKRKLFTRQYSRRHLLLHYKGLELVSRLGYEHERDVFTRILQSGLHGDGRKFVDYCGSFLH